MGISRVSGGGVWAISTRVAASHNTKTKALIIFCWE
jgi:hypothetical protein